jgi:hypothetical protein
MPSGLNLEPPTLGGAPQAVFYKDATGRVVLAGESAAVDGGGRLDLCRNYCMAALACPPGAGSGRRSGGIGARELYRLLVHTVRSGAAHPQTLCADDIAFLLILNRGDACSYDPLSALGLLHNSR